MLLTHEQGDTSRQLWTALMRTVLGSSSLSDGDASARLPRELVWDGACRPGLRESEIRQGNRRGYTRRKTSSNCGSSAELGALLEIVTIALHEGRETACSYGHVWRRGRAHSRRLICGLEPIRVSDDDGA